VGEVGIITNGVDAIQHRRVAASGLGQYISFIATSEACGYAKPDSRFFEYAADMARPVRREEMVIVGDRLDADILGANRYGIDSCWFNPERLPNIPKPFPPLKSPT
jgi:2-haloacid dehalogenase